MAEQRVDTGQPMTQARGEIACPEPGQHLFFDYPARLFIRNRLLQPAPRFDTHQAIVPGDQNQHAIVALRIAEPPAIKGTRRKTLQVVAF